MNTNQVNTRILSIAALLVVLALLPYHPARSTEPDLTAIQVGVFPTPYTRLIAIADAQGFFSTEGLKVELLPYPSGTDALEALIAGDVQICTVVDFRFAWRSLQVSGLKAIAFTGEVLPSLVIARGQENLQEPSDLVGKRIGAVPNTIAEFTFSTILAEHGIAIDDVTFVPLTIATQIEALEKRQVDAIAAFHPYTRQAQHLLGPDALTWKSAIVDTYHALLVTGPLSDLTIDAQSRFLSALLRAEAFEISNPEIAKRNVQDKWNLSKIVLDEYWDQTRISVGLDQSLVLSLNIYVEWLIRKNNLEKEHGNVMDLIDTRPLDNLRPSRVSIFR